MSSFQVAFHLPFPGTAVNAVRDKSAVILDTSSKYLFNGIQARPHIIKQNIHELESAFNVRLIGKNAVKKFIMALSEKYSVPVMIVTMDEKGALLFDRGSFLFYPPMKVRDVVSPVGCGDAFSAGLACGLSKGYDVEEACKLGVACASANLKHLGSCFLNKKDVFSLLKTATCISY